MQVRMILIWNSIVFRYIAPEQVPVQYGGLSKEGEQEFTPADPATEEIIKPTCKHTVDLPITEVGIFDDISLKKLRFGIF